MNVKIKIEYSTENEHYYLNDGCFSREVEVTEGVKNHILTVLKQYDEVQKLLEKLWKSVKFKPK